MNFLPQKGIKKKKHQRRLNKRNWAPYNAHREQIIIQ